MSSLLSIIQGHCLKSALDVPTSVIGSTSTGVKQLLQIFTELLDDLVNESNFNVTNYEAVFTAIAGEDQGAMSTLAPYGYQFALNETFFDRTLRRPLYGPLGPTEWQSIKALPNPGPFYKFRIYQDHLWINPAPAAPLSTIAFEYASSWPITSSLGVPKAALTDDGDLFLFPDRILRAGLAFRWKREKGLPYQADETQYYNLLNNFIARDKAKPRINLANPHPVDIQPGVFVPTGNWNV